MSFEKFINEGEKKKALRTKGKKPKLCMTKSSDEKVNKLMGINMSEQWYL